MKRVFLLLAALCFSSLLLAQDRILDAIENRFGIHFIYDSSLSHKLEKLKPKPAATLEASLKQTFTGTGIDWQVRGSNVILKPSRKPVRYGGTVTLSGYVTDSSSSEILIGAGVLAEGGRGLSTGAVTNEYGFYTITLPAGLYDIRAAQLGYADYEASVYIRRDTTINIALEFNARLDPARIVSRKDAGLQSVLPGAIEVPVLQLKNTPSLLGEADLEKALQLLPGVQGGVEGFSGLHVRGGGPEQNLVLLDGVPVYNMDHMLGLFSIFQPEAVKDVSLYKGAFPARYGGRVSSILDIRTNDGNMKQTHGSFSVGVLNDKFHLEGPIIKDRLSYSVSARGIHSIIAEPFLRLFLKDTYVNYYYYDLNGKLCWRLSDVDRFYLGVYHGRDNGAYRRNTEWTESRLDGNELIKEETDLCLGWGNTVGSLRWNHVIGGKLFSNSTVFYNNYNMKAGLGNNHLVFMNGSDLSNSWSIDYNSGITDIGARSDFDWIPSAQHLVKFGAEYMYHHFRPEAYTATVAAVHDDTYEKSGEDKNTYNGNEASLYIEDNMQIGSRLSFNPGLRFTMFNTQGRYYWSLEPRAAVKFDAGAGISLKGGYSRMSQYVHLLSSTIIPLPIDIWVPVTADIAPVTSDQFTLGAYYDGLKGWEFSVEAYYKPMHNLLEFKEGVMFLANTAGWENQVEPGDGLAKGLEFFVRKTSGATTGWVSYTIAKSERVFPDGSINLGRPYPYKYDRRHSVNVVVNHKFSERVDLAVSWVFYSGSWMTVPMRHTKIMVPEEGWGGHVSYNTARNNYNLPSTHRLNIGVNLRRPTKRGGESVWNLSLYNAYNAMNPNLMFYNYDSYVNPDEKLTIDKDVVFLTKVTILPIIPAFSYSLTF